MTLPTLTDVRNRTDVAIAPLLAMYLAADPNTLLMPLTLPELVATDAARSDDRRRCGHRERADDLARRRGAALGVDRKSVV